MVSADERVGCPAETHQLHSPEAHVATHISSCRSDGGHSQLNFSSAQEVVQHLVCLSSHQASSYKEVKGGLDYRLTLLLQT